MNINILLDQKTYSTQCATVRIHCDDNMDEFNFLKNAYKSHYIWIAILNVFFQYFA